MQVVAAPALQAPDRSTVLRVHGPLVWTLCRRLSREPEDDYQAIWVKVFDKLDAVEVRGGLGPWIATVARRHLIDRHRRNTVRGDVLEWADRPGTSVDPVDALHGQRQRERLERALDQLSPAHRRVVVLHHIHGIPLEQLAREEGVAVGTIKSRLHRGRARLAELMRGARA
jgi:RNA polymerase sigma-70 factor (ECF subfamily)